MLTGRAAIQRDPQSLVEQVKRKSMTFNKDKHQVLPQRGQSLWADMGWAWRGWGAGLWERPWGGGGQQAEHEHQLSVRLQ